jgi:SdrD B-like protein/DUF3048 family protein
VRKILVVLVVLLIQACAAAPRTASPLPTESPPPTITPRPPIAFPPGINPLTGQAAADPALLKVPALLISISNFPAIGRPQAGLSFAPFVYEIYITEGATRFLAVFYGEYPAPEIPLTGGCAVRSGAFVQTQTILGSRVWFDANGNGLQDQNERGVQGVCIGLYDAGGHPLEQTTTDTNGYYGFNVPPGRYFIDFVKPAGFDFTKLRAGEAALDSDADPASGLAEVDVQSDDLSLDAGLVPSSAPAPTPVTPAYLPLAQVGPIRSGRLIYGYIADFFKDSCLIYAFASEEVLARLPQCFMVFHQLSGGGYMLDISELQGLARDNQRQKGSDFDYASNIFSEEPPSGGTPASKLNVYIAYLNQSGWTYDPLYQSYLRSVDTSEMADAGILHPDTDRLTGRQLHFENVIVLFAGHEVVSPTNLDIHLNQDKQGDALLLRDGLMFHIKWSTLASDDRDKSRAQHPIAFLGPDGEPVPLKPGHTWVLVVTPDTTVQENSPGVWQLRFSFPPGAK